MTTQTRVRALLQQGRGHAAVLQMFDRAIAQTAEAES